MSALRTLVKDKSIRLTLVAVTVIGVVGIVISIFVREPLYAYIGGIAAFVSLVSAVAQYRQAAMAKAITARIALSSENEKLDVIERRLMRIGRILADTAGSVGRSAPVTRRIDAALSEIGSKVEQLTTNAPELVAPRTGAITTKAPTLQELPSAPRPVSDPTFGEVRVLMIADEFTQSAFSYEWTVAEATPDDWLDVIQQFEPHFVFVESAWEANHGAWRYQFVGPSAPRKEVVRLTEHCRTAGIPTVFWNKEDPPHFEDFLETARLFDHVFTTDGDMVPQYKVRLGHHRVSLLPFAAQPKLHNPARVEKLARDREIVFGGMYFRDKYPERREQMDMLLPEAKKLGLDIFSRNDGADSRYRFPEKFVDSVRGSLPYSQMVSAYHAYKIVVNVNSVIDSESMCARRVFEATACGAAVVTTPTPAVERFFGQDLLTFVSDASSAFHRMRTLSRSEELRTRRVHKAQRQIWEHDTYRHRAQDVMKAVGLDRVEAGKLYSVVVSTNRPDNLHSLLENYMRQNICDKELILITHGFSVSVQDIQDLAPMIDAESVTIISSDSDVSLGRNLNIGFEAARGDYLFRMDDDDYYGENYLRDQAHAIEYSGADLVGKAETYIYFESMDSTFLTYVGHAHRYTDFVRGATFAGPRETFRKFKFAELSRSEDSSFLSRLVESGAHIYSADPFNFIVNRKSDKSRHTWSVADDQLVGSGVMKYVGFDARQVEV